MMLKYKIIYTFGNKRPGPLGELIIRTSTIFSEVASPPSSDFLYLNGIHLTIENFFRNLVG